MLLNVLNTRYAELHPWQGTYVNSVTGSARKADVSGKLLDARQATAPPVICFWPTTLRTGKQKLAIAIAVGIYFCLEVAEQPGRILHFINDDWRWMTAKKACRILFCLFRFGWQVE